MDNSIYIIHGSSIVQKGLTEIILKNFKCKISSFIDFISFKEALDFIPSRALFFVEDTIANSEEYLDFLAKSSRAYSFSIVNSNLAKNQSINQYTLCLYDSQDEIYEQLKHLFNWQELEAAEPEGLSNREIDVLKLVALGYTNKEIADKLFISTHTVMSHRKNITEKLGIKSISGLTVYAIINNYIDTTNLDIKDLI